MAELTSDDFFVYPPPTGFENCGIYKGQISPPQSGEPLYAHKFMNLYDVASLYMMLDTGEYIGDGGFFASSGRPDRTFRASSISSMFASANGLVSKRSYGEPYNRIYDRTMISSYTLSNIEDEYGTDLYLNTYLRSLSRLDTMAVPSSYPRSDDDLSAYPFSFQQGSSSPFYCMKENAKILGKAARCKTEFLPSSYECTWSDGSHGQWHWILGNAGKQQELWTYWEPGQDGRDIVTHDENEVHTTSCNVSVMVTNCYNQGSGKTNFDYLDYILVAFARRQVDMYDGTHIDYTAFIPYDPQELGTMSFSTSDGIRFTGDLQPAFDEAQGVVDEAIGTIDFPPPSYTTEHHNVNTIWTMCGVLPFYMLKSSIAEKLLENN